uniref:B12-binding domain-containing radical SAM protein n=1 Tax=Clostridium TaxID=1485 RepID=UPI000CC3AEE4
MYYYKERKRVACVIPPFYRLIESKNNRLPPAMHYIAEILHRRGHEVIFINGDYVDDSFDYADRFSMTANSWLFNERYKNGHESFYNIINILSDFKPDVVFLSAGDVLIPTVELGSTQSCACLAKMIKEIIGPNVTCVGYGHLLRYAKEKDLKDLDVIIAGEGEEFATEIVEDNFRGKTKISWCNDMNSLPILSDRYIYYKPKPEDWDYIMSMRGCPNRCTFCHQPSLRGYNISMMSPVRFLRELRYRIDKIGTKGFYFSDMIFAPGAGPRTIEMLDRLTLLKSEYPEFNWWAESRVDSITSNDIVKKMKKAGCRHLKFGVEMANQDMLNTVRKGISLSEIKNAFSLTQNYG